VRRREVGLRLALGATRTQVAGQFVGSGIAVAGVGCAAGVAMSVVLTRLLGPPARDFDGQLVGNI